MRMFYSHVHSSNWESVGQACVQDPECVAWWVGRGAMWLFLVAFPWGGLFTLPSLASCFGCHRK